MPVVGAVRFPPRRAGLNPALTAADAINATSWNGKGGGGGGEAAWRFVDLGPAYTNGFNAALAPN